MAKPNYKFQKRQKDLAKQNNQSVEEAASRFVKQFRPTSLLQRFASVEEIANMVVYVASKEASATNGAALRAMASAWPRSSAPTPGYAPGVSIKVSTGKPKRSAI